MLLLIVKQWQHKLLTLLVITHCAACTHLKALITLVLFCFFNVRNCKTKTESVFDLALATHVVFVLWFSHLFPPFLRLSLPIFRLLVARYEQTWVFLVYFIEFVMCWFQLISSNLKKKLASTCQPPLLLQKTNKEHQNWQQQSQIQFKVYILEYMKSTKCSTSWHCVTMHRHKTP